MTFDEALRCFRPPGLRGIVNAAMRGPLQAVVEIYVPFRLYDVEINSRRGCQRLLLAIDAVQGAFDLYGFETMP